MPFSKIIGNDLAKAALQRMVDHHAVPHALLFHGLEGVGKSLFALAFAQMLMGPASAAKITAQNHPDLHPFRPEGKSAIHPIENIRKLIDEVALPPYEAPVKVFIIHDADHMLPYSSNALLKTLEEPSPQTYFILLTSSLESMLPTIVSRCRKLAFFPIPQAPIEQLIKERWQLTADQARRIAFLSQGSLAKAAQLAERGQIPWHQPLLEILSLHLPDEYPQFIKLAADIESELLPEPKEEGEEGASSLLTQTDLLFEEIATWYRDLHVLKEGVASEHLYHLENQERLQTLIRHPIPPLEKVLELISQSRLALQRNIKLRTVLEHFFLNLAK
jgi:DNA polymerase-3 subunit delta'